MTNMLSDWAKEFLREDRVGVVSTLNNDGSSHLTTMWYLLADDGTLVMSTPGRNQKVKNLRRDPRIALCVGDEARSVSLYGRVSISDDKAPVRQDIEHLVERYVKDAGIRPQVSETLVQQSRVALHFKPEKVTEFSVYRHLCCRLNWIVMGLPIAVQVVGKRWDESRLLAMAKALMEVTGPFQRPRATNDSRHKTMCNGLA